MNLDALRKLRETDATPTFSFPHELIDDPSLNLSQKREILAEWASDACAIESFPTLRLLPGTTFPVTLSSILDALTRLDDAADAAVERNVGEPWRDRNDGSSKRRRPREPHAISPAWRANAAHHPGSGSSLVRSPSKTSLALTAA